MALTKTSTYGATTSAATSTTALTVTLGTTSLIVVEFAIENGSAASLDAATAITTSGAAISFTKLCDTHPGADVNTCRVAMYAAYSDGTAGSRTITHNKASTGNERRLIVHVIEGAQPTLAAAIPSGNRQAVLQSAPTTNVALSFTPAGAGSMLVGSIADWVAVNSSSWTPNAGNTLSNGVGTAGSTYWTAACEPTTNPLATGSAFTWGASNVGSRFTAAAVEIVPAPPTYRSQSVATYSARINTTLTPPAGLANDDIMVVFIGGGANNVEITPPVPPAGWTQIGTTHYIKEAPGSNWTDCVNVWWKRANNESGNYTWVVDGGLTRDQAALLLCYSGCVKTGSPIDAFSYAGGSGQATSTDTATGTGTVATAPSITTSVGNTTLVNFVREWTDLAGSISPTSTWTERYDATGQPNYAQEKAPAAAGATGTVAVTCNAAAFPWQSWLIALAPDVGAPAAPAIQAPMASGRWNRTRVKPYRLNHIPPADYPSAGPQTYQLTATLAGTGGVTGDVTGGSYSPSNLSLFSTAIAPVGPFQFGPIEMTNLPWQINSMGAQGFGQATFIEKAGFAFIPVTNNGIISIRTQMGLGSGTMTDNVKCEIFATSGGFPTGSVLATASNQITGSTINGLDPFSGTSWVVFNFSTPYVPTAGTTYAAVFSRTGSLDDANYPSFSACSSPVPKDLASQILYNISGTPTWQQSTGSGALYEITTNGAPKYFAFGRDASSATSLVAAEAADPSASWIKNSTKAGFTTAVLLLRAHFVDNQNIVNFAIMDGTMSTSVAVKYVSFDMAAETWQASIETVSAAASITGALASGWGCDLQTRNNGDIVFVYNSATVTSHARLTYRMRTFNGGSYGTATRIDANGAFDSSKPAVLYNWTDNLIFGFTDTGTNKFVVRTLDSSNTLGTAVGTTTAGTAWGGGVYYWEFGSTSAFAGDFNVTSTDVPALTTTTNVACGDTRRAFLDAADSNHLYYIYINSSDNDVYMYHSTTNGASMTPSTTGSSILAATATQAKENLALDGNLYTRGTNVVIPYIVNDAGTWKFNEYTVRTVAGGPTTWQATATLAGTGGLIATPTQRMAASATFAGAGGLTANAIKDAGTATFAGTGGFTANAVLRMPANATFAGVGGLTADLFIGKFVTATFAGAGGLLVNEDMLFTARATFAGAGGLIADAFVYRPITATFAGAGGLTALATQWMAVSASFGGIGGMVADVTPPSATAWPASATLAGVGGLTADAFVYKPMVATFAGVGGFIAAPTQILTITATFAGVGGLTANAIKSAGTATFAGVGGFSATASQVIAITATFAGSGGFSANAVKSAGTATFAGAGGFNSAATQVMVATATFAGSGGLAANPFNAKPVTATFNGVGGFTGFITQVNVVSMTFDGAGGVVASPTQVMQASALFGGTGFISATLTPPGAQAYNITATLAGSGGIIASPTQWMQAIATLAGSGGISATLTPPPPQTYQLSATLTGAGGLVADPFIAKLVSATFAGTGGFTATVTAQRMAALATFAGVGGLAADALVAKPITATLAGSGGLSATITAQILAASATLAGSGGVVSSLTQIMQVTALFAGTGGLFATAGQPGGNATFAGAGGLTAQASILQAAAATFAGTGGLSATASKLGSPATLAGVGGFTAQAQQILAARATLAGSGGFTANATVAKPPLTASLAGAGGLTADATLVPRGPQTFQITATLGGTGGLTARPTQIMQATVIFAGTGGLTVTPPPPPPGASGAPAGGRGAAWGTRRRRPPEPQPEPCRIPVPPFKRPPLPGERERLPELVIDPRLIPSDLMVLQDQIFTIQDIADIEAFLAQLDQDEQDVEDIAELLALLDDD